MQKLRKMVKSIDKSREREREYYRLHIISERNEYIMELPDNTHSSEAATQMELVVEGFNPELPDKEKLRAAKEFDGLVQSTLLRFAGDAKTHDHDIIFSDRIQSEVLLEIPQKDGSVVSIGVYSGSLDNGTKSREITFVERGVGGYHRYYIEDDFVLRYDDNTPFSLMEEDDDKIDMSMMSDDEIYECAVRAMRKTENLIENCKLEQQMGLNRQPVGVEEISKLAELLESAEVFKFNY